MLKKPETGREKLGSYLFFRIPLFRPRHSLKRLLPVVAPLMSRGFLLLALIVGIIGIYLTSRQWDAFLATFADFYSLGGVVAYLAALIVIKNADDPAGTETWTYGALEDAVLRIAAGLKDLGDPSPSPPPEALLHD